MCGPKKFLPAGEKISSSLFNIPDQHTAQYRRLISSVHKNIETETQLSKAVQLQVQGQWTKRVNYVRNDLSWNSLLRTPINLLSFCISLTYDTLPSPSNLSRWQISSEPSCFLCHKPVCTVAHIFGACKVSSDQGRYTFRHNSVLTHLQSYIKDFVTQIKIYSSNVTKIP